LGRPERFEFAWAPVYRTAARLFGVTPSSAWVEIADAELEARFGAWKVRTPLANVDAVAVTGPYRFVKTAGPARLGITDRGLTFASNGDRGVRISFKSAVRGIARTDLLRHPELTVTVADPERLVELLTKRTTNAP
jgi:hypothetical protein